ncbi:MAG: histidinol dehydrogenase, partial [Oscillospiraceae bacterium]|nr:histidinol dehydrogenase [Oscillospiraceae bacterium]
MIRIFNYGEVSNDQIFARRGSSTDVEKVVAEIIAQVVEKGDEALFAYTKKFDKVELSSLEVSEAEFAEAMASVDDEFL